MCTKMIDGLKKQVDDWQPGLPKGHTSSQNLTEGESLVNLLCTYKTGQPPLILHFDTYKEVFEMLGDRRTEKRTWGYPIYLLKINGDRVELVKEIYPIDEHEKIDG